ncbi:hypothetical protein AX15_001698 [Amanita polypyramis BW_CC]|nr:hypothetical protein AX15_001698 [Amanita polypyramis BW_CC]
MDHAFAQAAPYFYHPVFGYAVYALPAHNYTTPVPQMPAFSPPSPESSSSGTDSPPLVPSVDLTGVSSAESRTLRPRHIPRPANAFFIFRKKYASEFKALTTCSNQSVVSANAGKAWHALTSEEKNHYTMLAEIVKEEHAKKYPGYAYKPQKKSTAARSARPLSKPYSVPFKAVSAGSTTQEVTMLPTGLPFAPSSEQNPVLGLEDVLNESVLADLETAGDSVGHIPPPATQGQSNCQFNFGPEPERAITPAQPDTFMSLLSSHATTPTPPEPYMSPLSTHAIMPISSEPYISPLSMHATTPTLPEPYVSPLSTRAITPISPSSYISPLSTVSSDEEVFTY